MNSTRGKIDSTARKLAAEASLTNIAQPFGVLADECGAGRLSQDVYNRPRRGISKCVADGAGPRACIEVGKRKARRLRDRQGLEKDRRLMSGGSRVRIGFRGYQLPVFMDRSSGILILHWARQIGKSFTLAAWAVDRLLTRPGRLVTVLSNSRENGAEFVAKCAEVCRLNGTRFETVDKSKGVQFQNMRMEVRIRAGGRTGRIKVLAANPRTARGFSGDLILDEFAFHEDSGAIWEAAEPILASNPDYLCRIASTGNGKHNLFYRMTEGISDLRYTIDAREGERECKIENVKCKNAAEDTDHASRQTGMWIKNESSNEEEEEARPAFAGLWRAGDEGCEGVLVGTGIGKSRAGFGVSRITRTMAHAMGVKIFDANTREEIEPEQARAQALDKRAYDQNYECAFADENSTLLSHELISAAEREDVGVICEQDWGNVLSPKSKVQSPKSEGEKSQGTDEAVPSKVLEFLRGMGGPLYVGFDVGRKVDLSVITVMEDLHGLKIVRAILRMQNLRLPEQQARLGEICRLPGFRRAAIDMTGLGLGLFEYAQKEFGSRIAGINFGTTVPATRAVELEGRKRETVRVTEALATELLQVYEDRRIQHPADQRLRDDLRKPERITTPGGRVSIAATRDEAGHADHFWSFALALEASGSAPAPFAFQVIRRRGERGCLL